MPSTEELHQAQVNRSIRTIKAELEYLCDSSIISPQQLSDLLSRIPAQTALHAPLSVGAIPPTTQNVGTNFPPPTSPMGNLSLQHTRTNGSFSGNEKQGYNSYLNQQQQQPVQSPSPQPPPAYASPPPQANWPPLAQATALYTYTSTDVGDLELQPNDHVTVTEYMNAEWWKGRSTRTGREGIFPRSYVKVIDEKSAPAQQSQYSNNYGNAPLEVSQVSQHFRGAHYKTTNTFRLVMELTLPQQRQKSKARNSARSWVTPRSLEPVLRLVATL